jgi:DNA-binding MarR family transcriptional regulator
MQTVPRTPKFHPDARAGGADPTTQGAIAKTDACTCARLRKITRRVTQIYDEFLEPSGLTVTQFGILGHVTAHGGSITVAPLADQLVTDPTTLSRNLRPLVTRGYIKMAPDPADRRRQMIWLTARGKTALRQALPRWSKAQAHVAAVVGTGDIGRLHALVDQSLARLNAA